MDPCPDAGGGEAEAAGTVEGFFGGAGEAAGGQDGVFVLVGAGEAEGEAPGAGGAAVAQSYEFDGLAIGQFAVDVSEAPVRASWLNQMEIRFTVVQRKVASPSGFPDLTQVGDRLRAFEDRYNAPAQPFR